LKIGRILLISLISLCVALAVAITLTVGWRPFIGPRARALTDRKFEATPARMERGRMLVTGLLGCEMCHTPKDWNTHGAPNIPGKELSGQILDFPGLPGTIVASNLTPDKQTGAGSWSDDAISRAVREGIGHDGRTIFPVMPYTEYRELSDEDVASVVVYVRSVPAVQNALPASSVKFPVNYLVRNAPQPVTAPVPGPNPSDTLARGKYMARMGCGCHTPTDRGAPIKGMEWAGGENLQGPWGEVTSANITPDASGISYYDEATFITTMRTGYVKARKLNSIMPFGEFQHLNDDDLKAMFAYLRTVPAVRHRVDNSLPPTYCKLCKQKHGAGDQN
jgi:mono/diheme cytochrome c family protein